jgi:DNA-binding response OmpR family regulator
VRILLAEDDRSLRQSLATALRRAGHRVVKAADGMEMMGILASHLLTGHARGAA